MSNKANHHSTGLTKARADVLYAPNDLTTKGDLLTHDGSSYVRLPVGSDDYVLTADSGDPNGIVWAPSQGGSGGDEALVKQIVWFYF